MWKLNNSSQNPIKKQQIKAFTAEYVHSASAEQFISWKNVVFC